MRDVYISCCQHNMPNKDRCCVPFCFEKRLKNAERKVTFHRFPKIHHWRNAWILKIRRDVGKFFKISDSTKVCSVHFKPCDFRKTLTGRKVLKREAVPSIFQWTKPKSPESQREKRSIRRRLLAEAAAELTTSDNGNGQSSHAATNIQLQSESKPLSKVTHACVEPTPTVNDHDYIASSTQVEEQSIEDMLLAAQERIHELEHKLNCLNGHTLPLVVQLQAKPDEITKFYTGFPSYQVLCATFYAIQPTAEKMYSWSQIQRLRNKAGSDQVCHLRELTSKNCKLPLFYQFYLFLHKLRLGSFNQELADKFNISVSSVSRIIISWSNFLYFVFGSMPIWPSREKVQKHMPQCFKQLYPRCRGIIDASEIRTEAPSSLVLNSEFYSSYKNHTTYKGNIFISPSGEVVHVSHLYTGSISDKELLTRSGLLDLLEPGDQILADKGFVCKDLLEPIGCELAIPAFLSSKGQFTREELVKSKKIHNLRVHVERAIRRVKEFHFFDRTIPLSMAGSVNQLWTVACLITNFQGPLFYEKCENN